ncbi:MAG: hypothetical protein E6K17_04830 [Methanobacteriota archaeon]|nr:MAG: hypothetical protein E6K17_04830 [Euryarchaeota archaeon]
MAAPMPPPVKLSSAALTGILVILGAMAAGVFAWILLLAPGLQIDQRLWWTGFVSLIFAFLSYLVYAGTESKPLRRLAGGLFIVSAGSFYGSIFTSAADMGIMLLWAVILSVLVVVVLLGVYVMAREAEATQARVARRRLTP